MLLEVIKQKQNAKQNEKAHQRFHVRQAEKAAWLKERHESQLAEAGVTMAKFGFFLEQKLKPMTERPIIFNEALVGANGLTDHIDNVNLPGKYFDTSGGCLGEWAGAVGVSMLRGRTIAVLGDGGFHYALQALWNAAREKLPLGLVVANNAGYGLLYSNMDAALTHRGIEKTSIPRQHYYELPDIDYVKIAAGYGVRGIKVTQENQIEVAIEQMLNAQGPFLIDLVLNHVAIPPMIHQFIFAHARPGMSEQQFQDYWINVHAVEYASKIPQIQRYMIDSRIPFGEEPEDPLFQGVAEIWLANEQDQLASLQSPEFLEGARRDEPRWAAFWRTVVLDTTTHVLLEGPPLEADSSLVKLFIMVKRRPGLSLEEFRRYSLPKMSDECPRYIFQQNTH